MKILFSGGGTMGPVTPLIAIFQEVKKRDPQASFFWLSTKTGPEVKVLQEYGIEYKKIF
jgi:UDP-N-acetylglucosamine:LPS N-acetylglucosamine transferase